MLINIFKQLYHKQTDKLDGWEFKEIEKESKSALIKLKM